MISGLTLEYAYARVAARIAQRPDERLWLQLRSARTVPALLEAVRASAAASTVSGIPLTGDAEVIEHAFRQQLRTRIDEVASWSPEAWQPAVHYTRHLVDLPAIAHLLTDEPPPRWMGVDPALSTYVHAGRTDRRAALLAGPLAPITRAIEEETPARAATEPLARALRRVRAGPPIHRAIAAWESEWRARWPRAASDLASALDDVVHAARRHVLSFATLIPDDTAAARQSLAARLIALLHRAAAQPAALFAYLALFALDVERLRGEFVVRARLGTPP
ncbi:MAG TPA: hypothetical protein VLN25_05225 [Burkholderiaceae bacterium]|nr:hypothetical protein [Burkholderiaceae bacterium]